MSTTPPSDVAVASRTPGPAISVNSSEFAEYERLRRRHTIRVVLDVMRANEEPLDAEQCEDLLSYVGRVDQPYVLTLAFDSRLVTLQAFRSLLAQTWSMAEYPDRVMTRHDWRHYFDLIGFTVDGISAARPTRPVLLYRGSVPERKRDWSWTSSLDVARRFAHGGLRGRPQGKVFSSKVGPTRILAINTERNEAEHIVDARRIVIQEVP